jgi:DNA gyrase subunit A
MMRGKVEIETIRKEREAIVITEIPFQVNKATMVERIAELVREKKIEGVSDLRDESSREGYRVVVELKREAIPEVVLNQLYRYTPLQTSFGANMVALEGGRPQVMNLKDLLASFLAFREEVVSRRTKFLLNKARDRAHVLVGLAIAVANIDEIIRLIRASKDANEAREALIARNWPAKAVEAMILLIDDPRHRINADGTYKLSDTQARAILDLRLQRLTALGVEEIQEELDKLAAEISDYLDILRSRARIQTIVKDELAKVKADFATPRRTEIVEQMDEVEEEDLIHREDMVITVSHQGYIKRVPLSTYRAQRRGGKGRAGMQTRDEDFVARLFVASTHAPMLYFSSLGKVYKLKVWKLPVAAPQARGKALINILPLAQGERITTIMPLPEDETTWDALDVMFATTKGTVRRNKLSDFSDVRPSGIIAMKLAEGEGIVDVQICRETDDVLLTAANGQCIRFAVPDVRVFAGRSSMGVRGISMEEGDRIISMTILRHVDASAEERAAYLKRANAVRRGDDADAADADDDADAEEAAADTIELGEKRYVEMSAAEQFVLTVTEKGMGKRTSSYEYRITNRGGKGIVAMGILEGKKGAKTIRKKTGKLVASFPVEEADQIMLVTDRGQLIRTKVEGIRIVSRSSQGVIVFDTAEDERVVSVERLSDDGDDVSNGS